MKKIIDKVLYFVVYLVSRIYTYRLSVWVKGKRDKLYTIWLCNFIGHVGLNTIFHYPIRLEGGGSSRIHIGNDCSFQPNCILGCWEKYRGIIYAPEIVIGDNCSIGEYCHITAINKITIGNGLLTGRFVFIGDNTHGSLSLEEADVPPIRRSLKSKGEIVIGNNVWIGDKVAVMGGVTIGNNAIIGANSIVTHDVAPFSVVGGNPAKLLRMNMVLHDSNEG